MANTPINTARTLERYRDNMLRAIERSVNYHRCAQQILELRYSCYELDQRGWESVASDWLRRADDSREEAGDWALMLAHAARFEQKMEALRDRE